MYIIFFELFTRFDPYHFLFLTINIWKYFLYYYIQSYIKNFGIFLIILAEAEIFCEKKFLPKPKAEISNFQKFAEAESRNFHFLKICRSRNLKFLLFKNLPKPKYRKFRCNTNHDIIPLNKTKFLMKNKKIIFFMLFVFFIYLSLLK